MGSFQPRLPLMAPSSSQGICEAQDLPWEHPPHPSRMLVLFTVEAVFRWRGEGQAANTPNHTVLLPLSHGSGKLFSKKHDKRTRVHRASL